MELRKVYEMGRGTLLVSLPKEWVKRYGLKKGDQISVEISEGGSITVSPLELSKEPREAIINYPLNSDYLANLLVAYYLSGYDTIKIAGKKRIEYTHRNTIKKVLDQLIGLEILEEDSYSITLQFLPDPSYLNPDKIFRRMNLIVQAMYKDAIVSTLEGDYDTTKSIIERDDEVDKLYFLLIRIVRSALMEPKIARKFGLRLIDCLDFRVGAKLFEGMGDASCELAEKIQRIEGKRLKENKELLLKLANKFSEIQNNLIDSFLKRSEEERFIPFPLELREDIERLKRNLLKDEMNLDCISFVSSIERIFKLLIDLADLSVPLYPLIK
ncbi:MAG: phosphate uptake regulator PhoU [Nitrososphaerales archaeon]